ncbi:hypothetical protein FOL47_008612 [Perkinsus chesapeaki]|uniref:Uncharacterized protein n=1 Tax=Perkinsus chesapeaki TaxID=330153 RepID=A0A7J6MTL0_PERCH|nr:hypothetical protein FOL47_008612 [Perkinsus chesapeaki]
MAVCGYAAAGIIPTVSEWRNDNLAGRVLLLSGLAAGNSSATSTDRENYGFVPAAFEILDWLYLSGAIVQAVLMSDASQKEIRRAYCRALFPHHPGRVCAD